MTRTRAAQLLGGFLGLTYIVLGLVESTIAVRASDPIVFFWFPALCGGGALVLTGTFKVVRPPMLSIGLVTVGALAGGLATAWDDSGADPVDRRDRPPHQPLTRTVDKRRLTLRRRRRAPVLWPLLGPAFLANKVRFDFDWQNLVEEGDRAARAPLRSGHDGSGR